MLSGHRIDEKPNQSSTPSSPLTPPPCLQDAHKKKKEKGNKIFSILSLHILPPPSPPPFFTHPLFI